MNAFQIRQNRELPTHLLGACQPLAAVVKDNAHSRPVHDGGSVPFPLPFSSISMSGSTMQNNRPHRSDRLHHKISIYDDRCRDKHHLTVIMLTITFVKLTVHNHAHTHAHTSTYARTTSQSWPLAFCSRTGQLHRCHLFSNKLTE